MTQDATLHRLPSRLEAIEQLTRPGAEFELVERDCRGGRFRVFRHVADTIPDLLTTAGDQFGDKTYLVYQDERITFGEMRERVLRMAGALQAHFGIQKGDRVVIAMRNYPEWVVSFLAVTLLGGITVAANAWWTRSEMETALKDCGAEVIIVDEERFARVGDKLEELGVYAVCVRCATADHPRAINFDDLILSQVTALEALPDLAPDDEVLIVYTSGSTSFPKGAVQTHRNILQAIESWRFDGAVGTLCAGGEVGREPFNIQYSLLLTTPMFHVSGNHAGVLQALAWGRKLVLMYKWNPAEALDLVEQESINFVGGPAAITGDLIREAAEQGRTLPSLLAIGGGGAPRAVEQVRDISRIVPTAVASTGWGMTETNAIGTGIAGEDYQNRPTSSGRPSILFDMKIVDEEGATLSTGDVGELWVRGPTVISYYWNRPDDVARSFSDGWFRSGDLARFDDEGFLYIVGRAKDMVLRGGENISCPQVEAAIYQYPDVAEVAVFGVPDSRLGEELVGVVVVLSRTPPVGADIRASLQERLAAFQVPREIEVRTSPLPRTASGKISKLALRDEWLERHGSHQAAEGSASRDS